MRAVHAGVRLVTGILAIAIALVGCAEVNILSGFGDRTTCEGGLRAWPHGGLDIAASYNAPVIAAADGFVTLAGPDPAGPTTGAWCGVAVGINHGFGASTRYCHLSQTTVNIGAEVKRGDTIGLVGTTGYTNPSGALPQCMHVHFELRRFGGPVDPLPFVDGCFDSKKQYPDGRLVLTYPVKCTPRRQR